MQFKFLVETLHMCLFQCDITAPGETYVVGILLMKEDGVGLYVAVSDGTLHHVLVPTSKKKVGKSERFVSQAKGVTSP